MMKGDRSRRGSAPLWRVGVAIVVVEIAVALTIWWVAGSAAVATIALIAVPVTAGILYLGARRLREDIARLQAGMAQWEVNDLPGRLSIRGSSELARLVRTLNESLARVRARMLDLRARQAEADAILQSMTSGVVALDPEHRIITTNLVAERLLRIDPSRARGRLLEEVVRQPELHRIVSDSMSGGARREIECTLPSGTRIEVRVEPLRPVQPRSDEKYPESAGAPPSAGLLLLFDDVTHLRRLETLRTDFAANVSHELRTPITNIKGYLETLLRIGVDDREQAKRFLEIIHRNVERLAAIVDDVMALTRLEQPTTRSLGGAEAPEQELNRVRTLLRPILESAIAQYRAAADQKSIEIMLNIDDSLVASVHPPLLEQAVANLLSNAVNYSPPRTLVSVSAQRTLDGEIEVAVADEGPGIAREHHERVFERFYRIDRGRSRDVGGTGLGLSIVKHIARAHGGRVELESELDRGSTFRIVFPE